MRVLRSSLLVAATAFIAAACGDKVTVAGPGPAAAGKINSVIVAPSSATISVGDAVTLTAAVNADVGITATVAWTSSSSAVTPATATGTSATFTGAAASPGVAVCATASATGVASVVSCGTVVVQAANVTSPATVQIASITAGGTIFPVPVPPGVVGGQIDVSINVNPGTEHLTKVVVYVTNTVTGVKTAADSQVFTSGQAAALRSAANAAVAKQQLVPTLLFSINTAAYIAATGAVKWPNGLMNISAVAFGTQAGSGSTLQSSASQTTSLLFFNADAWVVTQSVVAPGLHNPLTANNANGFAFTTGSISVAAVPVIYSGLTIGTANVQYGTGFCDLSGGPARIQPLVAPLAGTFAWTAVYTKTSSSTAGTATDVNSYEFDAVGCGFLNAAGGDGANISSSQYTNTNTGPTGFAAGSVAPAARLDNRGPGSPLAVQNPNGRQNGWINGTVLLTDTANTATENGWQQNGALDAGVGGYIVMDRMAASPAGLVDEALAATASATPTLPAPSATKDTYCVVLSATDKLGNESALPAAGDACTATTLASFTVPGGADGMTQLFGVDIAKPKATFSNAAGNLTANEVRLETPLSQDFVVGVLDTGIVGNSGMLAGTPVRMAMLRRNVTLGAEKSKNLKADGITAAANSTPSATGVGGALPNFNSTMAGVVVIPGYYTVTAVSYDAAGNSSDPITRVIVFDDGVAVPADVPVLTTAVFSTPIVGTSVTFSATASDNLDLASESYTLRYGVTLPNGLTRPILYPSVVINAFNAVPLKFAAVPANLALTNFAREIEQVNTNAPLVLYAPAFPDQFTGTVTDQGGSISAPATTAIPPGAVPLTPAAFSYATIVAAQLTDSWAITNGAVNVSDNGGPLAPTAALSVTLNADAFGPTATYQPPFVRVEWYVDNGVNLVQIGTASSVTSTVDDGTAQGRRHRWTTSFTPGTTFGLGALNIYVVGIDANGNALMSGVNANVTVINP